MANRIIQANEVINQLIAIEGFENMVKAWARQMKVLVNIIEEEPIDVQAKREEEITMYEKGLGVI